MVDIPEDRAAGDGICWDCGEDVEPEAGCNVYCIHCLSKASDPYGEEGIPLP